MLGVLRRSLRLSNDLTKSAAYFSQVRPSLDNVSSAVSPHTKVIARVESVQKRAARYATKRYRSTSSVGSMENLKSDSKDSRPTATQPENTSSMARDDGFVCRLRGLPFSASVDEIVEFFGDDVNIVGGRDGVHIRYFKPGRSTGEAFVQLASEDDCSKAIQKHKQHMGQRYVEVFRSKQSEMDWFIKRSGPDQTNFPNEAVVRLVGLPFDCSKEEIAEFFKGLEIAPDGIMLPQNRQGRVKKAYVQFVSQDIADRALQTKHLESIGHRYIEIYESTLDQASASMAMTDGGQGGYTETQGGNRSRQVPGSRYSSKTGHSVRMRGLPYQAQDSDVTDFFRPLNIVHIEFGKSEVHGLPNGEANVDFETHADAVEALKKHKTNMRMGGSGGGYSGGMQDWMDGWKHGQSNYTPF